MQVREVPKYKYTIYKTAIIILTLFSALQFLTLGERDLLRHRLLSSGWGLCVTGVAWL